MIFNMVLVLVLHFIGDFIYQSRWMGINKSTSLLALSCHIFTYTSILIIGTGVVYGILNGILHLITDYYTSRISSKLYLKNDMYKFWSLIGLDQLIHSLCLILTLPLLG